MIFSHPIKLSLTKSLGGFEVQKKCIWLVDYNSPLYLLYSYYLWTDFYSFFLIQGKFPRYSSFGDDIYYDPCPETRYQHWPAKSFQITDCLFEKSKCVSEGQKLCTTGTASTDSTCECDYKNGYAMIGGKCCSPTSYEDCTCFRKDCPDENQELDPGIFIVWQYPCSCHEMGGKKMLTLSNNQSVPLHGLTLNTLL